MSDSMSARELIDSAIGEYLSAIESPNFNCMEGPYSGFNAFHEKLTEDYGCADAILAAMPEIVRAMVKPLVWSGNQSLSPFSGEMYVVDWYDAGDLCTALTVNGTYEAGEMPMNDLKAAANAHHAAQLMAGLGLT